jgi:hypothetical protein
LVAVLIDATVFEPGVNLNRAEETIPLDPLSVEIMRSFLNGVDDSRCDAEG